MKHRFVLQNSESYPKRWRIQCKNCQLTLEVSGQLNQLGINGLKDGDEIEFFKWVDIIAPATCELYQMKKALT